MKSIILKFSRQKIRAIKTFAEEVRSTFRARKLLRQLKAVKFIYFLDHSGLELSCVYVTIVQLERNKDFNAIDIALNQVCRHPEQFSDDACTGLLRYTQPFSKRLRYWKTMRQHCQSIKKG